MSDDSNSSPAVHESYEPVPYYAPRAYASGPRRVIALLIDLFMTGLIFWGPYFSVAASRVPKELWDSPPAKLRRLQREAVGDLHVPLICGSLALAAAYQVLLRKTRIGTLGYFVMRIKLVGPDGQSPDWHSYAKRVLICFAEIFSIGLVYVMCFKNKKHQALHDQLAGTWLIKRRAKPEGPGRIIYKTRLLGVYPVTLIDVEPESAGMDAGDTSAA